MKLTMTVLAIVWSSVLMSQSDMTKLDSEYWSSLKQYKTKDAFGQTADCFSNEQAGIKWFEVHDLKTSQIQVQVLSRGKWGNLGDSVWFAAYEVHGDAGKRPFYCRTRHIPGKKTVAKNKVVFQLTDLDLRNQYWVAIGSSKANKTFTVRTTENFRQSKTAGSPTGESDSQMIYGTATTSDGAPAKGVSVTLLDENMDTVRIVKTDNDGGFVFSKLPAQESFMPLLDEDHVELDVFKLQNDIITAGSKDSDGTYRFSKEEADLRELRLLTPDQLQLDTKRGKYGVVGRIVNNRLEGKGVNGTKVKVFDRNHELLSEITSNENGEVVLANIESKDIQLEVEDIGTSYAEFAIVDDLNVPVRMASSDLMVEGKFQFYSLPEAKIELNRLEELDVQASATQTFDQLERGERVVLKNVRFASGSSNMSANSEMSLSLLAGKLIELEAMQLEVIGHTDNTGEDHKNLQLSEERAQAVSSALVKLGVKEDVLTSYGKGHSDPASTNHTESGRRQNRRVEIIWIK